jgi:microcystin-dependent protein
MSLLITDAVQGLADPTYVALPTGIVDPACLQVVMINGALRITIKKNSLDGSFFTGDFIPNGSITQAQLANSCVGTAQLQDGAVTTAKLADHAVTQIKLAFSAVTNTEIAAGTITSGNIAPNAIVTNLIHPGSVTGPCIANAAITAINFSPGAVNNAALQAACVAIPNLGADVLSLIQTSSGLPSGIILPTARITPPNGYLFCDGAQISRSVYASLYAALGGANSPWGQGDGSTTFQVPDLRGRTIIGAGAGAGLTNRGLGSKGGEESHFQSISEMPIHSHPVVDNGHSHVVNEPYHSHSISQVPHGHNITDPGHVHTYINQATRLGTDAKAGQSQDPWYDATQTTPLGFTNISIISNNANISVVQTKIGITIAGASTSIYNTNTGGGNPMNVMQPFAACNYIIKT